MKTNKTSFLLFLRSVSRKTNVKNAMLEITKSKLKARTAVLAVTAFQRETKPTSERK